jgi:hypothetical protein
LKSAQQIVLLFFLACCASACNEQQKGQYVPPLTAGSIADYSLTEVPSTELGNLILLLMPEEGAKVLWDWRSESVIRWIDSGYLEEGTSALRRGVVRVNVRGEASTLLGQRKEELAWTVIYSTDGPPKFGPRMISLQPGSVDSEACFGTLFDGCDFDPIPSLRAAGITVRGLCRDSKYDANFKRVYRLMAPGKRMMLFRWRENAGSGGSSSSYELLLEFSEKASCAFTTTASPN